MKKLNTVLWRVTRRVTPAAAIILLIATSSNLASCKKEKTSGPRIEGERLTGFVKDGIQTEAQGTNNGFFWSLYREGGSASITHGSGGNFAISYSNVNDVVGGKGWNPGSETTNVYNVGALSGSYNLVGI